MDQKLFYSSCLLLGSISSLLFESVSSWKTYQINPSTASNFMWVSEADFKVLSWEKFSSKFVQSRWTWTAINIEKKSGLFDGGDFHRELSILKKWNFVVNVNSSAYDLMAKCVSRSADICSKPELFHKCLWMK